MTIDDKDTKDGQQPEVTVEGAEADIEVTIEGEGQQAGADGGDPKPKRRSRVQGRMNALRSQATEAENRAREAETTAQRLERENAELKGQLQTVDAAAFDNYEGKVRANLDKAKADYKKAREDGDVDKEVEAAAEVGKWSSEQKKVDDWKAAQARKKDEPAPTRTEEPRRETQQPQQRQQEVSPEVQDWIADNPWFDPQSTEFDKEMHVEAVEFARALERKLARQGKQAEIGTEGYWKQVNEHIKQEFPDYFAGEVDEGGGGSRLPAMTRDERVTPIRSTSTPTGSGQQSGGPRKVQLTQDQAEFVRSMVDNGTPGYMKPDGTPISYGEAYKKFGASLLKDQQRQRERRVQS